MYSSILFSTIIKGILVYILALVLSKLIGIKIISQMNFFDFVMGVSIGSMIAKIIIDKDHVVFSGVIALIVFSLLTISTSYLNLKSYIARSIVNIEDVQFAIMESNGQLSVLIKADKKPITPYDMNIKVKNLSLINDIIIDGKIVDKNLQIVGVDEKWLKSELKKKNINAIEDVFYAGVDQNKKLTISERYPDNFNPEKKYGIE